MSRHFFQEHAWQRNELVSPTCRNFEVRLFSTDALISNAHRLRAYVFLQHSTCALWYPETEPLEEAQNNKHDLIGRKLKLKPGMKVLDIGGGKHVALWVVPG